jgi:sulfonate transport system substrate-binding protein
MQRSLFLNRRVFCLAIAALPSAARAAGSRLRMGYQKNGALLILKQKGTLESRLAERGVAVSWHEFPSGPPLLEALNADGIDFGATGDTPPLFAQAAGADLVYVAYQPAPGKSSAILVRADGPIRALGDLKGRSIAVTKGSSAHNVLVQALKRAGLAYGDIRPVYLQPPDAAAAFRQGAIDAWSIWDPFYAIAERDPGTRVLTTAETVAPSNSFFLARRAYAVESAPVVAAVIEESPWSPAGSARIRTNSPA